MNPVQWFEIPVAELHRAVVFYEYVFGLTLETEERGPLRLARFPWDGTAPGAGGALVEVSAHVPIRQGILIYFTVEDMEATLARVVEKNGTLLQPKAAIGENGFVGYILDSEGNRLGLHSWR
jgi:uncharacterized protein